MSTASSANRAALLCNNGHAVSKCKKLKPWQGHITARACNSCGQPIDRHDFRWRCGEHCEYDICRNCYDRHWHKVITAAKKIVDPIKRHELLQAVPEDRRPNERDLENRRTPDKVAASVLEEEQSWSKWALQLSLLLIVWVFATSLIQQGTFTLLSGKAPLMPDAWMVSGFMHAFGFVFCRLIASVLGYDSKDDLESVDTTAASVLGLMYGIETGLHCFTSSHVASASNHLCYLLQPVALGIAGILSGAESSAMLGAVAPALATVGAFLVAPTLPGWLSLMMSTPALVVANVFTVFRWVFTLNVLPRVGGFGPLFFLAYQVSMATAAVGFELAFMLDYSSYGKLFSVPEPLKALGLLVGLGMLCSAQLAVEYKVVQETNLIVLGLCAPMLNVLSEAVAVAGFGGHITARTVVGLLLCIAAPISYNFLHEKKAGTKVGTAQADSFDDSVHSNYQRLSDSQGSRRR